MKKTLLYTLAAIMFVTISCKKDPISPENPQNTNEEELITTVTIQLTDPDSNTFAYTWQDSDGDGGNAPTIDTIRLKAGISYNAKIFFSNSDEDITAEIKAEGTQHLICYIPSQLSNIAISRTDEDENGNKIGLESYWISAVGSIDGSLNISLKHQPDIKLGEDCSIGATDIDIDFPFQIRF